MINFNLNGDGMYKNGEIEYVMREFEKVVRGRKDREEDKDLWKKLQRYYQDGDVNKQFKMFLFGYQLGKSTERLN